METWTYSNLVLIEPRDLIFCLPSFIAWQDVERSEQIATAENWTRGPDSSPRRAFQNRQRCSNRTGWHFLPEGHSLQARLVSRSVGIFNIGIRGHWHAPNKTSVLTFDEFNVDIAESWCKLCSILSEVPKSQVWQSFYCKNNHIIVFFDHSFNCRHKPNFELLCVRAIYSRRWMPCWGCPSRYNCSGFTFALWFLALCGGT